jgi:hypothetical protein
MAARTWREKLDDSAPPVVKPAPVNIAGMKKGQVMLVPTAKMVEAFIRSIPPGQSLNVLGVRRALAEAHGAETTCPIYTGYHLRTVAEVACEERRRRRSHRSGGCWTPARRHRKSCRAALRSPSAGGRRASSLRPALIAPHLTLVIPDRSRAAANRQDLLVAGVASRSRTTALARVSGMTIVM